MKMQQFFSRRIFLERFHMTSHVRHIRVPKQKKQKKAAMLVSQTSLVVVEPFLICSNLIKALT